MKPNESPGQIPPLPQGPLAQEPYLMIWERQTTWLLQNHLAKFEAVDVPCPDRVLPFEDLPLFVGEGWR